MGVGPYPMTPLWIRAEACNYMCLFRLGSTFAFITKLFGTCNNKTHSMTFSCLAVYCLLLVLLCYAFVCVCGGRGLLRHLIIFLLSRVCSLVSVSVCHRLVVAFHGHSNLFYDMDVQNLITMY